MSGCHWENREDFVSRKTEAIEEVRETKVVRTVRIEKHRMFFNQNRGRGNPKGPEGYTEGSELKAGGGKKTVRSIPGNPEWLV